MRKTSVFSGIVLALTIGLLLPSSSATAAANIGDIQITDAVENEIMFDQAVRLANIDVDTADGVVTLSGTVNNLLAKRRAARLAESVKGVTAVINRIDVAPAAQRPAEEIRADVNNALLLDPATKSYNVDVAVSDGTVALDGTVQSWQERQLAEKVAAGVRGVTAVRNDLEVNYQADRPDGDIRNDIQEALRWDTLVDHGLIDVSVDDGEVTLTGTVGSAAEKSRAITDAWVANVTDMDATGLKVELWARDPSMREGKYADLSDETIRNALIRALARDPRVYSFNVRPEVDGGVVTLRGKVDNLKARRAAAEVARSTVGVHSVNNRVKVRTAADAARSDEAIEADIRAALTRDPFVDRFEIVVDSIGGVVSLAGTVDSYYEKSRADDVASRVDGVITVDNNLMVTDQLDPYAYNPYVDDTYVYDYDWYDYQPAYTFETDAEILDDIRGELFWSPFVDSDEVTVMVEDGVATLTGTVDSWSEYQAARENAYEGGATWVDNNLTVQGR
ncbi:MAG: BON domain-containing protein [Desulfococcaceae bacterium]